MGVEVTMTGPLFDGSATRIVDAFVEEASREIAEEGVNAVQDRLGQVLRDDTGRYRGGVTTDRASADGWTVTDGGVVYGPWLEGTSSRNKSTRFKGYQTFRRTRQWLDGRATQIAESKIGRYVNQMGG